MWRVVFLMLLVAGCTTVGGVSKPKREAELLVPEEFRDGIEKSLRLAGANRAEMKKFLRSVERERLSAAAFLLANMPPAALASVNAEDLLSEFRAAFKAREEFVWGKKIPDDVFLHSVLPNFITQEPFEKFREYLYPLLKPLLEGCESMEDAALELNRWCGKRFRYKPTQRRDQGVFESLKRGYGRCEEMMILYIAAARTVSIPARVASTPLWSTCDSNHAWVEVWCDGKWFYLGACEPADSLNTAWFTRAARRAPLVLARLFGRTEKLQAGEEVYRRIERDTIINTTKWYSDTAKVKVRLTRGGRPIPEKDVFFSVFNFGGLRPFARLVTDENGEASLTLGIGEFIASARDGEHYAVVKFETESNRETTVELKLGEQDLQEGFFWLKYPKKK